MRRYFRLIQKFLSAAVQNEMAHRSNFWISLLHTFLNLGTGVLGILVLFNQVETLKGWDLPSTMGLLGVYLTISALYRLFIGPSLDALAGLGGDIHTGKFDFTLLRPVDVQFIASLQHWRPLALLDLILGAGVVIFSVSLHGTQVSLVELTIFLVTLLAGTTILYAIVLIFTSLIFWSPALLYTWVFNGIFQMARYPVNLYPSWLRMILTWIIPVGLMTTIPAQALSGRLTPATLFASLVMSVILFIGSSLLFRTGLRKYASASS